MTIPAKHHRISDDMTRHAAGSSPVQSAAVATNVPTNGLTISGDEKYQRAPASSTISGGESASVSPPGDTASWRGWAELENDPAVFTVLLREWGVSGVSIREIVPLDAIFDSPSESIYGLVFLSRYAPAETPIAGKDPPEQLWFANQTASYSCATVALMNIIINRNDINLGPELANFRSVTQNLSPMDRGLALDDFGHVRDVHNSFATETDRLIVDARLKADAVAHARKVAKARQSHHPKQRQQKRRRFGVKKSKKHDSDDEDDEQGYHFIAYVPAAGRVWKMDGMERLPQCLAVLESHGGQAENEGWLDPVIADLQMQMQAAAESGEMEFSLLSVGRSRFEEGAGVGNEDDVKGRRLREDWGPLMAGLVRADAEMGRLDGVIEELEREKRDAKKGLA